MINSKFPQILCIEFRAPIHFQNFKVALNPMYRIFLNFAKSYVLSFLRPWQSRTHCGGHIIANTNVSPFARAPNTCCGHKFCVRDTENVSDFVQKHFVSATNVSQFAQSKKHHGQQCVPVYQCLYSIINQRVLKASSFM